MPVQIRPTPSMVIYKIEEEDSYIEVEKYGEQNGMYYVKVLDQENRIADVGDTAVIAEEWLEENWEKVLEE